MSGLLGVCPASSNRSPLSRPSNETAGVRVAFVGALSDGNSARTRSIRIYARTSLSSHSRLCRQLWDIRVHSLPLAAQPVIS